LGFPLVLPPFDQPQSLFILAKGRFDHGAAVIRIGDGGWGEVRPGGQDDRILVAALVLRRPNDPLPGSPTEPMGAQHRRHRTARARGRLPGPDDLAQLLHPATVADLGHGLIPATEQPVEPLGRAKAPIQA